MVLFDLDNVKDSSKNNFLIKSTINDLHIMSRRSCEDPDMTNAALSDTLLQFDLTANPIDPRLLPRLEQHAETLNASITQLLASVEQQVKQICDSSNQHLRILREGVDEWCQELDTAREQAVRMIEQCDALGSGLEAVYPLAHEMS